MSQLDLLSFINTHPSPAEPGQGGNINFWITTGSSGEFFVNGITIPLESQESTLATVIGQAEKIYFSLENNSIVRFEGPYIKKSGTITSILADQYVNGSGTFFTDELGVGDVLYVLDGGTLNVIGTVDGISDDSLLSLDTSGQYGYTITDAPYYVTGSQAIANNILFSDTINFEKSFNFTQYPDGSVFNGLNEYWFNYNPLLPGVSSEYGVKISTSGENLEVTSGSLTGQLAQQPVIYEAEISNKEKIVSGSLYHYYLIFDKPLQVYNNIIALTSQSLFNNSIFFEPSFTSTFKYSEYEVVGNDVQEPRKSKYLLKVDRNDSQTNPTNLTSILSSSLLNTQNIEEELFGDIQDSNYESFAWNNSRYNGTELTGSLTLPSAVYVTPFRGLLFDSNLSGSKLSQAITAKIGIQPQGEELYYYTPSKTAQFVERFEVSQSVFFTASLSGTLFREDTKINVIYYSGSGELKNVSQNENVTLQFSVTKNNKENYVESRVLTIPSGKSSGSLNWTSYKRSAYSTGFLGLGKTRVITTREKFVRVLDTTLPFVDVNYDPTFSSYDSNSIIPGTTTIYEFNKEGRFLVGVENKKVYNVADSVIYETSTQGTIVDIDDDDSIVT